MKTPQTQDGHAPEVAARPRRRPRPALLQAAPVLFPLGGMLACLAGVGALGIAVSSGAEDGLLSRWGLDVPDRIGVAAAVGAAAFLWLISALALRSRVAVLLRVRSALAAFGRGERCEGALRIAGDSPAGRSWNALLEWKSAEHESEDAKRLLTRQSAVDSVGDGVCDSLWQGVLVVDEQLVIRYANGAAAIFLRTKRSDLDGGDLRAVLAQHTSVLQAVQAAASSGSRQRQVLDVGKTSGEEANVLRFSVRAIGRDAGRRVLLVVEDVTQQRVADEVQQAFVAQAAHELRTPLTNIALYIEQLIGEDLTPAERGQALNVLNQETARLDKIVADMLSLSEIQSGQLNVNVGDIRLPAMFDSLQADYAAAAADKRIDLKFELPPKFPSIRGDRDKISIVLHNLIGNALKYTPEGGTVRVCVREEGDRLVVDVSDTGIGISEEDLARIFNRFARGNDSRVKALTGTGLGLALAREIARLHSGDVTAISEIDAGSTFTFWLPIATSTAAQAA